MVNEHHPYPPAEREGVAIEQGEDGYYEVYTAAVDKWTGDHLRVKLPEGNHWQSLYMPVEEIWRIRNVDRESVKVEKNENGNLMEVYRSGPRSTHIALPYRLESYGELYESVEQKRARADKITRKQLDDVPSSHVYKSKADDLSLIMQDLTGQLWVYSEERKNGKKRTLWNAASGNRKAKQIFEEYDDVHTVHFLDFKRGDFPFSTSRNLDGQTPAHTDKGETKMNVNDLLKSISGASFDEETIKSLEDALAAKRDEAKKITQARNDINLVLSESGYTLEQLFPEKFTSSARGSSTPRAASGDASKKRSKGVKLDPGATYKNPETGETYQAKRGARPSWIKGYLDRGELPPLG